MSLKSVPSRSTAGLRSRLLLWSAPIVLLLLLVGVKFLSVGFLAQDAKSAYAVGNAEQVERDGQKMGIVNVIEPFRAPFTMGTAKVVRKDFTAARAYFEESLRQAPESEKCMVSVNLVLSIEQLADQRVAAKDVPASKTLYDQALAVIKAAPAQCFQAKSEGNQNGEGDKLQEGKKRIEQKEKDGEAGSSRDAPGSPPAEGSAPPQTPQEKKLDQLKQQNEDSMRQRSNGQQDDEYFQQSPSVPYTDKPW
ncbi:hypothetical protein ACQR35_04460 [Pseudarthrobacter sp. J1738]|uniref:hypothetical protein n=1 Tax=unclassified Pseudarthrobacter TaxID=2647000 RepID=UPI003D2D8CAD